MAMNSEIDLLLGRRGELLREIKKSRNLIREADDNKNGRLVSENQSYLSVAEMELTIVDEKLDSLQGSISE